MPGRGSRGRQQEPMMGAPAMGAPAMGAPSMERDQRGMQGQMGQGRQIGMQNQRGGFEIEECSIGLQNKKTKRWKGLRFS